MSKKRVCSLLLIFALVLASFNVNLVEANAAAKPNHFDLMKMDTHPPFLS